MNAVYRFMRPIAFQNVPNALLPDALKDGNPLGIMRLVDDVYTDGAALVEQSATSPIQ